MDTPHVYYKQKVFTGNFKDEMRLRIQQIDCDWWEANEDLCAQAANI